MPLNDTEVVEVVKSIKKLKEDVERILVICKMLARIVKRIDGTFL